MVMRIHVQLGLLTVLALQCVEAPRDRCASTDFGEHQINLDVTPNHQWLSAAQPAVATGDDSALVVFSSALTRGDSPERSEVVLLRLGADTNVDRLCDVSYSKVLVAPRTESGFERLNWAILADTPKRDGPVLLVYARQIDNDLAPHELYGLLVDRNGCITDKLAPALLTVPESSGSPGNPTAIGLTDDSFVVLWPVFSPLDQRGRLKARLVSGANAELQLAAGPLDVDVAGRNVSRVIAAPIAPDRFAVAYTFTALSGNTKSALTVLGTGLEQGATLIMESADDVQDIIMGPSISIALHGDAGLLVWTQRDGSGVARARGRRFQIDGMTVTAMGDSWWMSPDAVEVGTVSVLAVAPDRYIFTYDATTDKYGPGDRRNVLMELLAADGSRLFTRYDCHEPPRPVQINHLVTENSQTDLSLIETNAGDLYGVFTDWGDTEATGNDRSGASIHAVHMRPSEL